MEVLRKNIGKAITKARRQGIVGYSIENLKQVTPTEGLTISPAEYHAEFERVARAVAKRRRFMIVE